MGKKLYDICLTDLLPEAKLICNYTNDHVGYMSRECETHHKDLYEYKDFFIVFEFSTDVYGTECDLDVYCIRYNFENDLNLLYEKCVTIIKKEDFDHKKYLSNINNDIKFLIEYFKKLPNKDKKMQFLKYMEYQYDQ